MSLASVNKSGGLRVFYCSWAIDGLLGCSSRTLERNDKIRTKIRTIRCVPLPTLPCYFISPLVAQWQYSVQYLVVVSARGSYEVRLESSENRSVQTRNANIKFALLLERAVAL